MLYVFFAAAAFGGAIYFAVRKKQEQCETCSAAPALLTAFVEEEPPPSAVMVQEPPERLPTSLPEVLSYGAAQVKSAVAGVDEKTKRFAQAIAKAEGFGTPGAIPTRANNPGDIIATRKDQPNINGKRVFPTVEAGWNALYSLITRMRTGNSAFYKPDMSFSEIAAIYVLGDINKVASNAPREWARNVTRVLGVPVTMTIREYFGGGQ